MNRDELGKLIKSIRKARKITQQELSAMTGINQPYISKVESGQLDISYLDMMKVIGVLRCKHLIVRKHPNDAIHQAT